MLKTKQGNPTILVPPLDMWSEGVRLFVCKGEKAKKVWQSYYLPASKDSVCVNCWEGAFINEFKGYAVLPAGDYTVMLEGRDNSCQELNSFCVVEQDAFSTTFTKPKDLWFSKDVEWHEYGQWNLEQGGIVAESGLACVFVEGDMHGILKGSFQINDKKTCGKFGLIARLYNASNHVRVSMTYDKDLLKIKLIRISGSSLCDVEEKVIAEEEVSIDSCLAHNVQWHFNGKKHEVWLNDVLILTAVEEYMGGVTVVGLFSETDSLYWQELSMQSTQLVPKYNIKHSAYRAMIRPGNIQQFYLLKSEMPDQNIFWESGIQFGHIGGSEIKFTQNTRLNMVYSGEVCSQVQWEGPMPKFVEQSDDIRGWARGVSSFYPDRLVLADYVTARTNRSVGPDFDMMSRALAGPARVALSGEQTFQEWILPDDGAMKGLELQDPSEIFPVCIAFPLKLGDELWWLKAIIVNLLHVNDSSAAAFAWRCSYGLTASHDFRVLPTKPGMEYGFSILVEWQQSSSSKLVEQDLLNLRDDWCTPVIIEPQIGSVISYPDQRDQPAEAMEFSGCFDRSTGVYGLVAENGHFLDNLDPLDISRRTLMLKAEGLGTGEIECKLNGQLLELGKGYLEQNLTNTNKLIIIKKSIDQKTTLEIRQK
jgi:hypothetical protein